MSTFASMLSVSQIEIGQLESEWKTKDLKENGLYVKLNCFTYHVTLLIHHGGKISEDFIDTNNISLYIRHKQLIELHDCRDGAINYM